MQNERRAPRGLRFSPRHIWNGHLKGLKNRDFKQAEPVGVPDRRGRLALYGLPLLAAALVVWRGVTLETVDGLLSAAGILAGGLFMAFSQVASWRERFTARLATSEVSQRPQRYALDETVAHILMATYACLALLVIVLAGSNFQTDEAELSVLWSALTVGVGLYVILLLLIILPKLYSAYVVTQEVDSEMSGHSH